MPKNPSAARLVRTFRTGLVATFAALSLAAVAGPISTAAASTSMPTEGIFETCSLNTEMATCLQRLNVMQQGGVQVVLLPVTDGSPANLAAYAAAAQTLGMQVMWETSDSGWWQNTSEATEFSQFAQACGCDTNSSLLTYMIQFLSALPGTYGYYAADDWSLTPADHAGVAQYVAAIKAIDPNHPVVLSSNQESQTKQYEDIGDMNAAEIYPVTTDSLMPASNNQDMWGSVAQEASDDQGTADKAGKSSAFILQAFTFGDNLADGEAVGVCTPSDTAQSCAAQLQYPTAGAQLELRNEILEHAHPKLILWYSFQGTYGDVTGDTASIYPSGATAASRWAGLAAAIQAPSPTATTSTATTSTSPVAHITRTAAKHSKRKARKHRKHRAHTARKHHRRAKRAIRRA